MPPGDWQKLWGFPVASVVEKTLRHLNWRGTSCSQALMLLGHSFSNNVIRSRIDDRPGGPEAGSHGWSASGTRGPNERTNPMRPGGARVTVSRQPRENAVITSRRGLSASSPAGRPESRAPFGAPHVFNRWYHGFRFASPVATGPRPFRGVGKLPNFCQSLRPFTLPV